MIIRVSRKVEPRYKPQCIPIFIQDAVQEPVLRGQGGARGVELRNRGRIATCRADEKKVDVGKLGPRGRLCSQDFAEVG